MVLAYYYLATTFDHFLLFSGNHIQELSKQGKTILQIEDKNLNLEKKIADMDSRINEISSIMVDMAALLSEINHNSSKPQHHTQNEESFNLEVSLISGFVFIN